MSDSRTETRESNPFGTSAEIQQEMRENARERLATERLGARPSDHDDAMRGWSAQMGGAPLAEVNPAYVEDPVVFSAEQLPPPEEMARSLQKPQDIPPEQLPGDVRDDYASRVRENQPIDATGVREKDLERVREVAEQRGIADRVSGLGDREQPATAADRSTQE